MRLCGRVLCVRGAYRQNPNRRSWKAFCISCWIKHLRRLSDIKDVMSGYLAPQPNRARLLSEHRNCYLARIVLVRMRMDIRPRCCVHPESVMTRVEVCGKLDERPYSFPAFTCEADCGLLYNITHGYFRISDGRISPDGQFRIPCPNDASPMYLETEAGTYRCSQFGCDA
jgi:hypothetical protein